MSEGKIEALRYGFGEFVLDVPDRQLWRGDTRIDLNARYLDALVLLVRERGQLVEKERFFDEVWNDVVVSDSALTQCIKEIRKQIGDDASNPRYIQTVPRHGYRFIGPAEPIASVRTKSDSHQQEHETGETRVGEAEPRSDGEEWRMPPSQSQEDHPFSLSVPPIVILSI